MTIVVANVVAADLSTVENRGRVLGLMHGLQLVVGTGSPALGGVIGEVFGTRTPFYVSGIAVLTFALWGILRLPETRPAPGPQGAAHARHSGFGSGARVLLRDPSFLMVCILGFSTFFLRGGMSTTLIPIYADDILRMGPGQIGLLFTISSLMHSVLIYPAGAMADKYGRKIVIIPAGILVGLTIIAPAFLRDVGALRNVVPAAARRAGLGRTGAHRLRGGSRASGHARHGHRHVPNVRRRCRHHRPRHLDESPRLLVSRGVRIQRGAMDDNRHSIRLHRSRNGRGHGASAGPRSATGCGRGDPDAPLTPERIERCRRPRAVRAA